MNNIQINIYTSNIEFEKLFLNVDNNKIKLNQNDIELSKSDFITIVNKILNITRKWENSGLIKLNHYQKIIVQINIQFYYICFYLIHKMN